MIITMTIGAIIAAMILAGAFIFWEIQRLTKPEIKKKVHELKDSGAAKVAIAQVMHIAKNSDVYEIDLEELNRLADEEGIKCAVIALDENDNVIGDVELVKEEEPSSQKDIEKLLGGKEYVVY